MWIFLLLIFVLTQGTLAEVDCTADELELCKRPKLFYYIPRELSEYDTLCPEMAGYMKCLKEFQDSCDNRGYFRSQDEYDVMYGAFSDLCTKGTLFNNVISKHLKCFNETFRETSCTEKMKIITGPYRNVINNIEEDYTYFLPLNIMCLEDILQSSCISAELGENCGQDALEATLEFLRKISYVRDFCGKEEAKYLLESLDEFILTKEQKEILIVTLEGILISGGRGRQIIPY